MEQILSKFKEQILGYKINKVIISNSYDYKGRSYEEYITRAIDISKLRQGKYLLTIDVVDNCSKIKVSNNRIIEILPTPDFVKGIELRDSLKIDEAIDVFKDAKNKDKKNPEILYQLAVTYSKTRKNTDAKKCLEKALKISPDNTRYLEKLAEVENMMGLRTEAIDIYNKLIEIDSTNINAYIKIADIHLFEGFYQYDRKKWSYDRRKELSLGFDKFLQRKFDDGERILKEGIRKNPDNRKLIQKLGVLYLEADKLDDLKQLCLEVLKHDPGFKEAHYFLAYVYFKKLEFKKAEHEFELAKGAMSGEELTNVKSFLEVFKYLDDARIKKRKTAANLGYEFFDLSFCFNTSLFKGKDNLTDVEIYYKIPFTDLHLKMMVKQKTVSFNQKCFLINEYGDIIDENLKSVDIPINYLPLDVGSTIKLKAEAGKYYLILLFEDIYGGFSGTVKIPLEIKEFKSFSISDIVLGESIQNDAKIAGRNMISPEASLIFSGEIITSYFEIYDLKLENRKTDFEVRAKVYKYVNNNLVNRQFIENTIKESTPLSYQNFEYSGDNKDHNILFSIDISKLLPNGYILIIEVFDKNRDKIDFTYKIFKIKHN